MMRCFSLAVCAGICWAGLAHSETKSFNIGDFNAIDVSAGIDVRFSTGQEPSAIAENPEGDFRDIEISVRGDRLIIKRRKSLWNWGWGRRAAYQVTVTGDGVSAIQASSGAGITGKGLRGEVVRIKVSSGAGAEIGDIVGTRVILQTSSGSSLTAEGTCQDVDAKASSGSDLAAGGLECEQADADASSGSNIRVYARSALVADASSGAGIVVYGRPQNVVTDTSSGGSVVLRD